MARVLDPDTVLVGMAGEVAAVGALGTGVVVLVVEVVPSGDIADRGHPDVRVEVADELVDGEVPVELVDVGDVVAGPLVDAVVEVHVVFLVGVQGVGHPAHLSRAVVERDAPVGIARPSAVLVGLQGELVVRVTARAVALPAHVLDVEVDDAGPVRGGCVDVQVVAYVELAGSRVEVQHPIQARVGPVGEPVVGVEVVQASVAVCPQLAIVGELVLKVGQAH